MITNKNLNEIKNCYISNNAKIYKILNNWKNGNYSEEQREDYSSLVIENTNLKLIIIRMFNDILISELY
jgi:hypothetical protein